MNLIDGKRKLRITFQALTIVAIVFYLMHLQLPKSFNSKSISLLILIMVSCVGLVSIAVRINCQNVRRWEMVVYYLLNIVFVWIIVYSVMELCYIAEQVEIDNIPYTNGTDEYYNAYDNAEEIGWIASFMFVLWGIPSIIMTIIFAIIGIIQTCIQKPQAESEELLSVEDNLNAISDLKQEPRDKHNNTNLNKDIKINYCSYCGQKVDIDANFCKYCGKEIK